MYQIPVTNMKTATLTFLISSIFLSNVWAQKSESTVFFEKKNDKILRIEKYKSFDVVSEKNFTIPIYTVNEDPLFRMDRNLVTYNKEKMIKLVSGFISNNKKHFNLGALKSVSITCYFDKNTFELKEIVYRLDSRLLARYSILRDLTEEIKTKGDLSIKSDFKARIERHRSDVNKYAAQYFFLYFTLYDTDLKL
jgi:hypothetical protein